MLRDGRVRLRKLGVDDARPRDVQRVRLDPAGLPYATNLYFGTPCFNGFFDLAELAWTPQIARNVQLRLAARAYFDSLGFLGWQQICSLRFCL